MTTYTTDELGILLGLEPYPVRISFLKKADAAGWLTPSVRQRTGSGKGTALYSADDLVLGRAVLAVYPLPRVTQATPSGLTANRCRLAAMVRQTPLHRWLMFCGKAGRRTNRAESVVAFYADHAGEVVTVLDLDQFREGAAMVSG